MGDIQSTLEAEQLNIKELERNAEEACKNGDMKADEQLLIAESINAAGRKIVDELHNCEKNNSRLQTLLLHMLQEQIQQILADINSLNELAESIETKKIAELK